MVCLQAATTNGGFCAYCEKPSNQLEALYNEDLLNMMRELSRRFTQTTKFCSLCRYRIFAKYSSRKRNRSFMEKMAPAYDDDDGDETSSYSNASSGD